MPADEPYHVKVASDLKQGFGLGVIGGMIWAGAKTMTLLSGSALGNGLMMDTASIFLPAMGVIAAGCAIGAAAGLAWGAVAHSPLFSPHRHGADTAHDIARYREQHPDLPVAAPVHAPVTTDPAVTNFHRDRLARESVGATPSQRW